VNWCYRFLKLGYLIIWRKVARNKQIIHSISKYRGIVFLKVETFTQLGKWFNTLTTDIDKIKMDATHENIKAILFEILSEYPQRARIEKTFIDAYSEYLRWGEFSLSKKTLTGIKTAYNHFIAFRGNVALHEIDKRFIDQFAITLMKKAPKGSRVYFRSYRAMFQKFVEWGFIPKNSFSSLKLPKQQRNELKYFTENEFLSLAEKETNQNLRDLFILCFYLGLRLAE